MQNPRVPIPELTTERLRLRGFGDRDRAPFAAMNADSRVMEHFPRTLTRAESDGFVDRIISRWARDGHGLWVVESLADGRFLGFTGLVLERVDFPFAPAVEVGWRYAVDAWGNGYATESARAAVRFGFEELALGEILSWTIPANGPSRRVMERIGMAHDPADDFDHPHHLGNERIRRHVLYRLTRERWAASAAAELEGADDTTGSSCRAAVDSNRRCRRAHVNKRFKPAAPVAAVALDAAAGASSATT